MTTPKTNNSVKDAATSRENKLAQRKKEIYRLKNGKL